MMNSLMRMILMGFGLLVAAPIFAQAEPSWLENTMYESGKINVVLTVVALVFTIIVVYLVTLDRRLKKMEANEKNIEK